MPKNRLTDYTSLLIGGVILVTVSQGIEGLQGFAAQFVRGILVGLSIVCSLAGLYLYTKNR